jgi:hypothetical protein
MEIYREYTLSEEEFLFLTRTIQNQEERLKWHREALKEARGLARRFYADHRANCFRCRDSCCVESGGA